MTKAQDFENALSDTEQKKNARKAAEEAKKARADRRKLKDKIEDINRLYINYPTKEIARLNKEIEEFAAAGVSYYEANKNTPGYPTVEQQVELDKYKAEIDKRKLEIQKNQIQIDKWTKEINKIKQEIAEKNKIINKNSGGTIDVPEKPQGSNPTTVDAPKSKRLKFSSDYKYNAPMVRAAYYNTPSFQSTILEGNRVDAGKYNDARQAWKGTKGGRGTIQMDEKFLSAFTTTTTSPDKVKIDTQKYGFKFLYNPQTVQMAWGVLNYMSPPYEATGQDPFQPISVGLLSSAVSFELLINRIEDFNYIDENGLSNNTFNSALEKENALLSLSETTDPATRQQILNSFLTPSLPYPEPVSNDELKEIYNKGTMYDIEYLLKTLNGPDSTFTSKLNGLTSDRAYLRPAIVELHLGASMRYRVRIGEFSVNHIMFNPRMVPILSSVKLTCNRYADGPEVDYYGPATATATSSGGTGGRAWSGSPDSEERRAAG